jgi:hypothetical protein
MKNSRVILVGACAVALGLVLAWWGAVRMKLRIKNYWTQLAQESEKGKERFRALDQARSSAPYLQDFQRLFPEGEISYSYWGGTDEPGYVMEVDLHGRYEFELRLPVRFDASRRSVSGYGEPTFYLREFSKQEGQARTYNPAGEHRFGTSEWRKVVENGGSFQVIGCSIVSNQPVVGYQDRNQLQTR